MSLLDPSLDAEFMTSKDGKCQCNRLGNSREKIEQRGGPNASDYSTVFLPWGPEWNADKVRRLMYTKDMVLNSKWYDPNKKIHTHPCFMGTMR